MTPPLLIKWVLFNDFHLMLLQDLKSSSKTLFIKRKYFCESSTQESMERTNTSLQQKNTISVDRDV